MVAINLPIFAGMAPAIDKRLLDDKFSQDAENVWIYSGALDALPVKTNIHTLVNPFARSAYRIPANNDDPSYIFDGTWIEFNDVDTDFLKAPVADDTFRRYYWTSKTQAYPMYNTQARIEAGQPGYILGIPQPGNLNVVVTGGSSATLVARSYVATLVSAYGEEGPASNPFTVEGAKIDATFTVTLPAVAANDMGVDRNITKIRLYRTIVSSGGTATYYLAAEVPARTTTQDVIDPYTNLLLRSEELDNASWTKLNTTVTANAITDPAGGVSADKLVETAVNGVHSVSSAAMTIVSGAPVSGSMHFKAGERTTAQLRLVSGANNVNIGINLTDGTITAPTITGTAFSGVVASIDKLTNGWYRVNISSATTGITTVTMTATIGLPGADSYLGVITNGLYLWGAQLTATVAMMTYVATAGATVLFRLTDAVLSSRSILESTVWTAPPSLDGFVIMPNGIMAGFRENELWFSEPYRPHAWPAPYSQSLEYEIVGLGVIGATLVVCTKGNPFTASGVHPSVITTSRIATFEPCTVKGSIVATENGCYYTSPNGIILVNPGIAENITRQLITKDKWYTFANEAKVNAGRFGTAYLAYNASISSSFDPAFQEDMVQQDDYIGNVTGFYIDPANQNVSFIRLLDDENVISIKNDPWSSELYFIREGVVQWLDFRPSYQREAYKWKSKQFQTTMIKNFTAYKLWFDPSGPVPPNPQDFDVAQVFDPANQYGIVRIYADGAVVACHEFRTSGELMRLPSGYKADFWEIEIEARVRVSKFQMATSVKELQVA